MAAGLTPLPRPVGLVLAGGRATRMSGALKPLQAVGGRTILARILDRLAPQCDTVAISVRGDPAPFAAFADVLLPDPEPDGRGPLAGILAGLRHLADTGRTDQPLLSVPGDTPFLPADLADRLGAARSAARVPIAVAASAGRSHPVIALWPVSVLPLLEAVLLGENRRGVAAFQSRVPLALASWTADPLDPFFNVNTPEDLRRANHLARFSGS